MSKGIIYVMSTVVPGLIKIGKTGCDKYEQRMYNLERHGYSNVVGLKREFAIEVSSYDEKEKLLIEIFNKSRVSNSELFALELNTVIQLLSSFEGKQIYPINETKGDVFKRIQEQLDLKSLPNETFYLTREIKSFGKVKGIARIENGYLVVKKGSYCRDIFDKGSPEICQTAKIENNILQEDIICNSPTAGGYIVLGKANNGWKEWKTNTGIPLENYRKKNQT